MSEIHPPPVSELELAISRLRDDDKYSDFSFIVDGIHEFKIHKCILASRSDVFRDMMIQTKQKQATITNCYFMIVGVK
jgi:hypothetical protein